ncbi:integral to membrane protein [Moniliophthora roreri MCA 2997]|uniref:Glycerophosphocholine acyltransferase 1 n=2 Tax=Moniliophthora roreri TaxID=221103 RepID=V2XIT3_MONRO|nr:integral to membrane protein [Moniliophthora roreri MCA 2997]KAI3610968.1 integral to membrane protein [Moniliophthora roreri]
MGSRPPSPILNGGKNYFSGPFERFLRDDMSGDFTLLDTMETYFDSHVDLLQRKLQKHSDRLKMKAEETFKIRDLSGDLLAENFEKEVKNFKLKVSQRMTKLAATWQSAKVVRTREKVSFFFGVMSLLFSALMFGMAPEWVPTAYTIQGVYLLSLRVYMYKKLAYHYFLFDLCYFVTILNFIYIWYLPSSPALFVACYCLSHGSLGSAVITWRNSLVFHDTDKVTSLFIHVYAPYTFTVIRHFYPNAEQRFPALTELQHLNPTRAMLLSGGIYLVWQLLYWKFVLVDRWSKIESGQRTTSFSFLLNQKRGFIGRGLAAIPPKTRLWAFMAGQLVYTILTEVPAVYVLYDSPFWSGAFLILIFGVSVWNGGGYYIEVFGRKFERELEQLRKELAEASSRSSVSGRSSPTASDDGLSSLDSSPTLVNQTLPSVDRPIVSDEAILERAPPQTILVSSPELISMNDKDKKEQ